MSKTKADYKKRRSEQQRDAKSNYEESNLRRPAPDVELANESYSGDRNKRWMDGLWLELGLIAVTILLFLGISIASMRQKNSTFD